MFQHVQVTIQFAASQFFLRPEGKIYRNKDCLITRLLHVVGWLLALCTLTKGASNTPSYSWVTWKVTSLFSFFSRFCGLRLFALYLLCICLPCLRRASELSPSFILLTSLAAFDGLPPFHSSIPTPFAFVLSLSWLSSLLLNKEVWFLQL